MKMSARMAVIRNGLKWSATGKWSARVVPEDAAVLVHLIDHYYELLEAEHGRVRTVRHETQGAAGDQGGTQAEAPA